MSIPPYIPASDSGFLEWATNFRDRVAADAGLYGLNAADSSAITTVVDDFETKYTLASQPITRTKQRISDKDVARITAETLLRQYAIDVKYNSGVTDGDKENLGVRPVNTNRTPITVPMTSPILSIIANTPGSQTVRYSDSLTPDSRAKPFGASELQLYRAVTDSENVTFADAEFYGKFTRNPIGVEFSMDDNQKVATYWARWASKKGEVGPWSLPISMAIAA